ncbi:MAG: hypothetical protein VW547_01985 [Alphaproteobacteria bacterium]
MSLEMLMGAAGLLVGIIGSALGLMWRQGRSEARTDLKLAQVESMANENRTRLEKCAERLGGVDSAIALINQAHDGTARAVTDLRRDIDRRFDRLERMILHKRGDTDPGE